MLESLFKIICGLLRLRIRKKILELGDPVSGRGIWVRVFLKIPLELVLRSHLLLRHDLCPPPTTLLDRNVTSTISKSGGQSASITMVISSSYD